MQRMVTYHASVQVWGSMSPNGVVILRRVDGYLSISYWARSRVYREIFDLAFEDDSPRRQVEYLTMHE
jgi:hypothetical protein